MLFEFTTFLIQFLVHLLLFNDILFIPFICTEIIITLLVCNDSSFIGLMFLVATLKIETLNNLVRPHILPLQGTFKCKYCSMFKLCICRQYEDIISLKTKLVSSPSYVSKVLVLCENSFPSTWLLNHLVSLY